jgi:glucosyl-3-phosphoglycerate phosphatase
LLLVRHGQSEFNVAFSATRVDPGIPDPVLTALGQAQAEQVADSLRAARVTRLVASPYTRTLETATIIASLLKVPVAIEPLVRERAAFACDIGSAPTTLAQRFPDLSFAHLDDPWWHDHIGLGIAESETSLAARCDAFRRAMRDALDWDRVAVITHWGFIRAMTGQSAGNCAVLRLERELPL